MLFVPLFLDAGPKFQQGEYQLTVLDVGQGSAAVIQTQNHTLVFDAGAKFSDKLNAGSGVVIPYLRSQGIESLDRLIVSHGDADHIGGAQVILDEYPGVHLIGQNIEKLQLNDSANKPVSKQLCSAGLSWHWDGVDFIFLAPEKTGSLVQKNAKRNNRSCVLRVKSTSGSILLTGDIEKKAEQKLLSLYGQSLASDILVVPHHGSNTSSSLAFLNAVNPKLSLISVGYKNKYRLPSAKVLARYRELDRFLLQTNQNGAVTVKMDGEAGFNIEKHREISKKYWHHTNF